MLLIVHRSGFVGAPRVVASWSRRFLENIQIAEFATSREEYEMEAKAEIEIVKIRTAQSFIRKKFFEGRLGLE